MKCFGPSNRCLNVEYVLHSRVTLTVDPRGFDRIYVLYMCGQVIFYFLTDTGNNIEINNNDKKKYCCLVKYMASEFIRLKDSVWEGRHTFTHQY